MAKIYDLTDIWNAAGTVFNAIKMNVTDTASAAGSLIMNLQVGGATRFTVDKTGAGAFAGPVSPRVSTVAALPAAASYPYALAFVSDATAVTARSIVAGAGTNKVLVMSDGTNWLIVA